MDETRDERRRVLLSAVEQFLDHLEDDFDSTIELQSVVIAGEIRMRDLDATIPSFWCSNENPIWQRGFFETLSDYKRVVVVPGFGDDDDE